MPEDIVVNKLGTADLDQVSRFRMADDAALEIFIRRHARKSADASLTKTYVAKIDGATRVSAYVTIMCAEVALERTYAIPDKAGADGWDYHPAVRIARLAVEDGSRAGGLGTMLIELALGIVLETIEPHIGCRFVIVDAKPKSISFYEKLGFRLLDTATNREKATPLMFLDLRTLMAG